MKNRVRGSNVTAGQTTASEQPIFRGPEEGVEFAGDDFFDVSGFTEDPDARTVAGVVRIDDYSADRMIWSHRDSTSPTIDTFFSDATGGVEAFAIDGDGNQARTGGLAVPPSAGTPFAFVARYGLSGSTLTVDMDLSNGQSGADSVSMTNDNFTSSREQVGRKADTGGFFMIGRMYEHSGCSNSFRSNGGYD
ncbi:MAG: hypothetical protein ABEN55_02715 [Bradymonadaceae bacterium]